MNPVKHSHSGAPQSSPEEPTREHIATGAITENEPGRTTRRTAYALLIVLSVASATGRTLAVNSVERWGLEDYLRREGRTDWQRQRPFLSANDRSRWCSIRALVEHGTYAIDDVIVENGWDTIDMVKHDGHLYSSKPPLWPTLMAGQYWLIHRLTGATLASRPYEIGRVMLLTWQVIPWALYLVLVVGWCERYARSDFSRLWAAAFVALGTMLTPFLVSLNNHLPAAIAAALSLEGLLRVRIENDRRARWFVLVGIGAAVAAANELPALAWLAACSALLAWVDWRRTAIAFGVPVLLVASASLGTNYAAHGTLLPAYAQRSAGKNWYDYTYEVRGHVRESYWRNRKGIDRGEPSRAQYALHVLVGHHGVFSLTPAWLLVPLGAWGWLSTRSQGTRQLTAAIVAVSAVCLAFYLARPLEDRNYGGMTAGFRWMFWFAPLWLWTMLPALDRAAKRRWSRGLCLALLALSVLSASYPTWNPWTHPWIYNALAHWRMLPS